MIASSPRRPQMSVRNRTTASNTPTGIAIASVARTSPVVSSASRAGRARPRVSRSNSAVPAGSIAAPVSGSSSDGSTPCHRASRSAAPDQPARRIARSSFGTACVASRIVAIAGQPTTRTSAIARTSFARSPQIRLTISAPPPASGRPSSRTPRRPIPRSSPARANTPARSRSSPRGSPSCLIASRYGGKSTTPRPGGRSPCTLPSQSEMCTWATRPFNSVDRRRRLMRQGQVRNIQVGLHRRVIHVVQELRHAGDVVQEREVERLELQRDLQTERTGIFAQRADVLDAGRATARPAGSPPSARCIRPAPGGRSCASKNYAMSR